MNSNLHQLLTDRLKLQGIGLEDSPLFLKDLASILKGQPAPDLSEVNGRLNLLGWHQVQMDYHSLQLALAWMEANGAV